MKSEDYQQILQHNVGPSVRKLGLPQRSWVFQMDNDPKHTSKSTRKWFERKHWRLLRWPAMSPDLNPIEHLWRDLKMAVWRRHPSNIRDLEQFAKEEWSKIPAEHCKKLIDATFMISTKTPYIYARLADSALLDCAFTVDHRADVSITWTYQGRGSQEVKLLSYNGHTKKLEYMKKDFYMQVEELENGNASLLVNNLAMTSEGLYTCSVSVASLFPEQQIHLQIRERPMVNLNVDSVLTLQEGDEQKFACDASSYYPLDVNIEWLRELPNTGLVPSVMSNVIYSSHRNNPNGTYSLTGFFLHKVSLQDDGIKFTCRVEHESLKKPIRKSGRVGFRETRLSQKSSRVKSADYREKSGIDRNTKPNASQWGSIVGKSPAWFLLVFITFLILALLYFLRMFCKGI
ncbi:unnamed protein product [Ranitomeya imitator]|uniref:Ig-like domain-containing protein n=1 Tax=Ranitomeya imitator TaxID=111125 RepID=A0ABN9L0Q0_9NEOB|nr:unnamed protein product [Ranitomeya imitator]